MIVLPGMELQTREEVHLLCLFDTLEQLAAWQSLVDEHLPPLENDIEYFGEQFVVDADGDFIRRETAAAADFGRPVAGRSDRGSERDRGAGDPGAHRSQGERPAGNLGLCARRMPPIDALEISRHITVDVAPLRYPQIRGYPLVQDGDAHRLNEFLGVNEFVIESPTIAELKMALRRENGRAHRFRLA